MYEHVFLMLNEFLDARQCQHGRHARLFRRLYANLGAQFRQLIGLNRVHGILKCRDHAHHGRARGCTDDVPAVIGFIVEANDAASLMLQGLILLACAAVLALPGSI